MDETRLPRRKGELAFTLIELMVVIAIIAILASLLLPVLGQAKKKAMSIACANKVRQWGVALRMYTDDHQEKFPFKGTPRNPINAGPNKKAWYNSAASYIGSDALTNLYATKRWPIPGKGGMFMCPDPTNMMLHTMPTTNRPFFAYGMNGRLVSDDGRTYVTEDAILKPVQTIIFTDNTERNIPYVTGRNFLARHNLKLNVAFADGHVSGVKSNLLFRSRRLDSSAKLEWSTNRQVYWYPHPSMRR